ncbi:Predicted phosphohydrolase, Cof family, HAD superfamily [Belliella pelovolcani]|uniref:Predicted phosphohydrolase, Cof family, HAD superfamily n=2 Tax=Belliella pelovolcani TaxID=529505 RepID=A0A1N7K0S8_9BACT|nr:Predicted phosphohydrolase, Cof family, HAD superfamily [Belliella pelovolcani]
MEVPWGIFLADLNISFPDMHKVLFLYSMDIQMTDQCPKISITNRIKPMQDPKSLTSVAAFHQTFKHPILSQPKIPDAKRCELRVSLIAEELKELEEAIADQNIVEIADALCDIQYVLSGAILEFGLAEKFKDLFDEVQRSNMSKACKDLAEAEATVAHYQNQGVDCFYEKEGEMYLVFRAGDRKTLKSVNYSPADLKSILI